MEFIIKYRGFEKCQEAMQYLSKQKLKFKHEKEDSFHAWLELATDFLALGKQCEIQSTKNYEHYPRLSKEWAYECLKKAFMMSDDVFKEYANSYIETFDLNYYLAQYH